MKHWIIALILLSCNPYVGVSSSKPNVLHDIKTEPRAEALPEIKLIKSSIKSLSDADFFHAIKGKTVVVEYYANWCYVCEQLNSNVERMAQRHPDVTFYRVDVDTEKEATDDQEIHKIPALVLFRHGMAVGRLNAREMNSDAAMDSFLDGDTL